MSAGRAMLPIHKNSQRLRFLLVIPLLAWHTVLCWNPTADQTFGPRLYNPLSNPYAHIHGLRAEEYALLRAPAAAPVVDFPDCVDLDEYCTHVHALSYDEVPAPEGFRCEEDDDCQGGRCPSGGGACVCPQNQVGGNCGALVLFSQRWLWMLNHNGSDLVQRSDAWVDVGTHVIPPDASQLAQDAVQYVLRRAIASSTPKNAMWWQQGGAAGTASSDQQAQQVMRPGLKLRLPPPAVVREWFTSVDAIVEYLQLLVGEWSLIQDVHQSERDQLTMDKLYAEVVFVVGCAIVLQRSSAEPLAVNGAAVADTAAVDNRVVDLTPVVADALNGAHNAVIWAVKNALRFYDAQTTTRTEVLRNGEPWFFELLRLFCFMGRAGGLGLFRVNPIAQDDGRELGACREAHCASPGKSLLRRAVRVGLEPAVRALLQLNPPPQAAAAALPAAIANNDARVVDLLQSFAKGESPDVASAVSARGELRDSALRLASASSSPTLMVSTTCSTATAASASASASASTRFAAEPTDFLAEIRLNGTSCAIDVVDVSQFPGAAGLERVFQTLRNYVKNGRPVVVRGLLTAASSGDTATRSPPPPPIMSSREWSLAQIQRRFGTRPVTLSKIPYAENFGREHRRGQLQEMFSLYPDMLRSPGCFANDVPNSSGLLARAADYVFDSEFLHSDEFKVPDCNHTAADNDDNNEDDDDDDDENSNDDDGGGGNAPAPVTAYTWLTGGNSSCAPDGASSTEDPGRMYLDLLADTLGNDGQLWHQWYLGPRGSGSPLHYHCQAFNTLAFGEKLWILVPPSQGTVSRPNVEHADSDDNDDNDDNDADEDLLAWGYSNVHPAAWIKENAGVLRKHPSASVCTQHAGDTLFVPSFWSHATLNLQASTGFATEVYSDC